MMLARLRLVLSLEAEWVEHSLLRVLGGGYRTPDIIEPGRAAPWAGRAFMEILREEMQRTLEHARTLRLGPV